MTVAAHNPDQSTTDSADVRVRVRGTQTGSVVPLRPRSGAASAHARAIPREDPQDKMPKSGKIRNFVSQHAGEVVESTKTGWLATKQPRPLVDTLNSTIPTRAEYPRVWPWLLALATRIFRLVVHTIAYTAYEATDTDKRAGVALALTALFVAVTILAAALGGR